MRGGASLTGAMSLGLEEGSFYTLMVRRHAKLSDQEAIDLSDLEFVEPFDTGEVVTFIDLEYVGTGLFEWATSPCPVFLDRSGLVRGAGMRYRMFRESEIISAKPTDAD